MTSEAEQDPILDIKNILIINCIIICAYTVIEQIVTNMKYDWQVCVCVCVVEVGGGAGLERECVCIHACIIVGVSACVGVCALILQGNNSRISNHQIIPK